MLLIVDTAKHTLCDISLNLSYPYVSVRKSKTLDCSFFYLLYYVTNFVLFNYIVSFNQDKLFAFFSE